jgi:hypothetical protein
MTFHPASKALLAALALAAAPTTALAQPDDRIERYGAVADIQLHSTEGLQRLELPLAVLQSSRSAGYADLRVFDARGEPVPMAWAHSAPRGAAATRTFAVPRFAWPAPAAGASATPGIATPTTVQINAAGAVVRIEGAPAAEPAAPAGAASAWLLDLSALTDPAERITHVLLDWPQREGGLATGVHMESSDDAVTWRSIARGQLLDLAQSGAPALKQLDWPAPERTPRYLRLNFDTPLDLARSDLALSQAPAERPRSTQRFVFAAGAGGTAPQPWVLDLHGRVPLSHITPHLPQTNTVATLTLQQRNDLQQPWRTVTSFTAWRLTRDGREITSPAAAFDAPPARYWQLVPDARTGGWGQPTLEATLEWTAPVLVFTARGVPGPGAAAAAPEASAPAGDGAALPAGGPAGGGLRLAVGREVQPSAQPGLATLMPGYVYGAEHQLPAATLTPLRLQAVAEPGLPQRLRDAGPADQRRWVLWGVLVLAVAGLGWLAWKLVREVGRAGKGQSP